MGHITKRQTSRGEIRYEAKYRDPSGRQRCKWFALKRDAENFLAKQTVDLSDGQWVDPQGGRTLFRDWVVQWKRMRLDLRPSSKRSIFSVVDRLVLPVFGEIPLGQIKQPAIQAWIAGLHGRGFTRNYILKAHSSMRQIMQAAVVAGLIKSSPCHDIKLPKGDPKEMHFLTPAQVELLASVITPRYRALVLLGCWGGLRIGEMAALRRSQIDFLRGTVSVVGTCYYDEDFHLSVGPPKTRASRRTVSLPRPVIEELAAHCQRFGVEEDGFVFAGPEGGILRPTAFNQHHWQPAVRHAGLGPLRQHDMRHTAISIWIASGMNAKEVSARAGHTSVRFTYDQYGHLFEENTRASLDRLEAMMAAAGSEVTEATITVLQPRGNPAERSGTSRSQPYSAEAKEQLSEGDGALTRYAKSL